jgi:hypothetical protein
MGTRISQRLSVQGRAGALLPVRPMAGLLMPATALMGGRQLALWATLSETVTAEREQAGTSVARGK